MSAWAKFSAYCAPVEAAHERAAAIRWPLSNADENADENASDARALVLIPLLFCFCFACVFAIVIWRGLSAFLRVGIRENHSPEE